MFTVFVYIHILYRCSDVLINIYSVHRNCFIALKVVNIFSTQLKIFKKYLQDFFLVAEFLFNIVLRIVLTNPSFIEPGGPQHLPGFFFPFKNLYHSSFQAMIIL